MKKIDKHPLIIFGNINTNQKEKLEELEDYIFDSLFKKELGNLDSMNYDENEKDFNIHFLFDSDVPEKLYEVLTKEVFALFDCLNIATSVIVSRNGNEKEIYN